AEPRGGRDRTLEVHPVARRQLADGGLVQRLAHHVGGERVRSAGGRDGGDGEAAAVDRDRVAERGVLEDGTRGDGEPDRVALVLDGGDGAELLDDAGEHVSSLSGGASGS